MVRQHAFQYARRVTFQKSNQVHTHNLKNEKCFRSSCGSRQTAGQLRGDEKDHPKRRQRLLQAIDTELSSDWTLTATVLTISIRRTWPTRSVIPRLTLTRGSCGEVSILRDCAVVEIGATESGIASSLSIPRPTHCDGQGCCSRRRWWHWPASCSRT